MISPMIPLIIWTIAGITAVICQLITNRLPSYAFWITYAMLMIVLVERVILL